jgi:uncharacterized protein
MAIYQHGGTAEIGPQDLSTGLALLERTCERGDYLACHELATLYARGERVERDLARAEALYTRMCEIDYSISCLQLGHLHSIEHAEHPKDVGKALTSYLQACDAGASAGCMAAGRLLLLDTASRDEPRARALFETACEDGQISACSELAHMLERGQGGPLDHARARVLYQRSCDAGARYECIALAHSYLDADAGHGAPDQGEAILDKLCREATLADPDAITIGAFACHDLGQHFSGRDLVRQDLDQARAAFERGCELGYDRSCATLGEGLVKGRPFAADPKRGLQLLARAVELEPKHNTIKLGVALVEAASPHGDPERGLAMLDAECRNDRELACSHLYRLYRSGTTSVPADTGKAVEYAELDCFRSYGANDLRLRASAMSCIEAANLRQRSTDPRVRDDAKIVAVLARACEIQPSLHCRRLAKLYETGELETVPRDGARAKVLHEQACLAGDAQSCGGSSVTSDVDCLLDPSLSKCKRAPSEPDSAAKLPAKLSVSQITAGIKPIRAAVARCGAEHGAASGIKVRIEITIEGATGKVVSATVLAEHEGTPLGECAEAAAKQVVFPRFEAATQGFQVSFQT